MYMYVQVHVCACAHLKHRGQRSVSGVIPQELPTLFFGFVFVMDGVSHWGRQCSNLAALPSEPSPTSAFSFMALRFSPAILRPFCMFESFSFSVNMWGSMTKTVTGWRDGSAGKSTGWSSRGSRFGSRYPHSYVQPSITGFMEFEALFWPLWDCKHVMHTCKETLYTWKERQTSVITLRLFTFVCLLVC